MLGMLRGGLRTAETGERGPQGGFSLVELIVAITLLGVLMLGFLPVFPLGMRTVEKGKQISAATDLAQERMEWIKSLPSGDPNLDPGQHAAADNPVDGLYTVTWTVFDDEPVPGMKRVDVTVGFSDLSGPRTIVVSSHLRD